MTFSDDVVQALKQEAGAKSAVKIVFDGKFYDIRDIYTIEDDDTYDYICIEADTKQRGNI